VRQVVQTARSVERRAPSLRALRVDACTHVLLQLGEGWGRRGRHGTAVERHALPQLTVVQLDARVAIGAIALLVAIAPAEPLILVTDTGVVGVSAFAAAVTGRAQAARTTTGLGRVGIACLTPGAGFGAARSASAGDGAAGGQGDDRVPGAFAASERQGAHKRTAHDTADRHVGNIHRRAPLAAQIARSAGGMSRFDQWATLYSCRTVEHGQEGLPGSC
jgi:hypothetical protein